MNARLCDSCQKYVNQAIPRTEEGEHWIDIRLGHTIPMLEIQSTKSWRFQDLNAGLWLRQVQSEYMKDCGFFLYSLRATELPYLTELLTKFVNEDPLARLLEEPAQIGLHWRAITANCKRNYSRSGQDLSSGNQMRQRRICSGKGSTR
jgi:hypothetical protein